MSLTPEPVQLDELLAEALTLNQGFADRFAVKLRLEGELARVMVRADRKRLMQVVTNLLSNAAKFSPRGGVVEVAVSRAAGEARVAVTDHGRGIPPEFQGNVFERFAQADSSSTRERGGTGLGLSISRAIVERHRGRIGFTSEPGVATIFFFDLPEWGAVTAAATRRRRSPAGGRGDRPPHPPGAARPRRGPP